MTQERLDVSSLNRLDALRQVVGSASQVLILIHNNPDPDAIGGAVAMRYLLQEIAGLKSRIVYNGIIGRSENKALVRYLGRPLHRLTPSELAAAEAIILMDTQPGAGNNALPLHLIPAAVIDHHPWREQSRAAPFVDVRPEVGATASIMMEYLKAAELKPPPRIATALFYGIKTDTLGLGRHTTFIDTEAICRLLPRLDVEAISKIERAQVPPAYFKNFTAALQTARIYDGVIISYLGEMGYPDLTAEIADFLLRLQNCRWVICMGCYKRRLILSVRTHQPQGAGQLAQTIIGKRGIAGGHGSMAGGQLQLKKVEAPEQVVALFSQRILTYLDIGLDASQGQPLI